ncbi:MULTISPECIES: hypothetical protein [Mycobacterium]|uniref:Uncharacterized protein n=1 Tax=Mycobacterium kiyosense TaxID=2871094 RepID=A0A9P3Q4D2_9MYCO|nr:MULTISPECIES: hypothetical protein [Mycobacterium]BDB40783.1 hypothetical protein IWGMT90018_12290 [Mycobacterium kiyosense]BDE12586.1 hypothetical protein MKCMC460_14460 [Mycobacterium sp. 20KCMC460]GLB84912.1 hypothetical protein SRL2020028_41680 [Mycobacterium kiyosense]GLB87967.1 hypothetical protein SRL2020130_07840 [Mycobacterium kiyosense]GLB98061.1 hypothetical protein SRL2020226_48370 [Mycobacterium kiyosense]
MIALIMALAAAVVILPAGTATAEAPRTEIWQWAIGRNVFTDPALQQYSRLLGINRSTDVYVESKGFSMSCDGGGNVVSVTLYNDEVAVGWRRPGNNTFRAYRGALPARLTWNTRARDLHFVYGAPNMVAGFPPDRIIPIAFATRTTDHWFDLVLEFATGYAENLPSAPILRITVSPGPNYQVSG